MTQKLRWFLDTEFIEDGRTIDLVSIGLVCEDGRELYMVSKVYDQTRLLADPWLKTNVWPHIKNVAPTYLRSEMAEEIAFELQSTKSRQPAEPEIWAHYASYDWIALCQLFGRMIDLPPGFPMYCRDLKQVMDEKKIGRESLPVQDPATEHSAIEDARWLKAAYDSIFTKP